MVTNSDPYPRFHVEIGCLHDAASGNRVRFLASAEPTGEESPPEFRRRVAFHVVCHQVLSRLSDGALYEAVESLADIYECDERRLAAASRLQFAERPEAPKSFAPKGVRTLMSPRFVITDDEE